MRPAAVLLLAALVAALGAVSCATPGGRSENPKDRDYVLVYLKSGPRVQEKTAAERTSIQAAHMANIGRLARDGTLVLAGPFGKENHDPTTRGIFAFDVRTIDEATALTNTDPAVEAGVLAMELHTFRTAADLRGAIAAELALDEAAKREGRERPMSETIRGYVMLRVDDDAKAQPVLAKLAPGQALVAATVDGGRGFYILNATTVAAAKAMFGDEQALGSHTFDEWWASAQLENIR